MLWLIVMRHAKSSWADPGQRDHDRPLNKRGRRSATLLGGWLAAHEYVPDLALVSSAVRTRETWSGVEATSHPAPATFVPELYDAGPGLILKIVKKGGGDARVLLVMAHQPGIGAFAARVLSAPPSDPDFALYPTGATTVIQFGANAWRDVGWGSGTVLDFVVPRILEPDTAPGSE